MLKAPDRTGPGLCSDKDAAENAFPTPGTKKTEATKRRDLNAGL